MSYQQLLRHGIHFMDDETLAVTAFYPTENGFAVECSKDIVEFALPNFEVLRNTNPLVFELQDFGSDEDGNSVYFKFRGTFYEVFRREVDGRNKWICVSRHDLIGNGTFTIPKSSDYTVFTDCYIYHRIDWKLFIYDIKDSELIVEIELSNSKPGFYQRPSKAFPKVSHENIVRNSDTWEFSGGGRQCDIGLKTCPMGTVQVIEDWTENLKEE